MKCNHFVVTNFISCWPTTTTKTKKTTTSFHLSKNRKAKLKPNPISLSLNNYQSHSSSLAFYSSCTNNCSNQERQQQKKPPQTNNYRNDTDPHRDHSQSNHSRCSIRSNTENSKYPEPENRQRSRNFDKDSSFEIKTHRGIFTNMWWVDLKAALGQRINIEGVVSSASVILKNRELALPHVFVPDVRCIDWGELHRRGFKGVVFDKDNTITVPYSLALWGPIESSIEQCKSIFGNDVAVFSNSAGLFEYDLYGSKAKALEKAIGIKVIRHRVKKPAGTAKEIESHFGCDSSQLIMVGDRPFTDIVFGNRNGFFTVLTEPLSLTEEPFIVRQVRKLEVFLVNSWLRSRLKPVTHPLLPNAGQCVRDPQPPL